jgi:hypothetical protein
MLFANDVVRSVVSTHWGQLFLHGSNIQSHGGFNVLLCAMTPLLIKQTLFHMINITGQFSQLRFAFGFESYVRQIC